MQASMARGAQAYYQTQIRSQSPLELVVMLYDGALRFLGLALDAVQRHDLRAKRDAMSRSLAILSELQNSLNMEAGGEVATRLDGLYTYMTERLVEANLNNAPEPIEETIRLLTLLRSAWAEIAGPGKVSLT